jgi:hypothetical protein
MITRLLLALALTLSQIGCTGEVEEEVGLHKPIDLTPQLRGGLERLKREFLQLEDIKMGDGPLAAWGRKITADIEVRYADGTLVYRGPAIVYFGMRGSVFIHDDIHERGMLSLQQDGIILGLNGMAVRGKRRMIVAPNLVCYEGAVGESTSKGADPRVTCALVATEGRLEKNQSNIVRKETLIVEATLTASCIPGYSVGISKREVRCRDSDVPRHDPSAPIWRVY